jgi:HEAT repeat protein
VVRLLHDQDAAVRIDAVNLLGELKKKSALAPVLELLDDGSDEVVLSVLRTAQVLGDSADASSLIAKAARVGDPEFRTEILKAALAMGDPRAIPGLIRVIADGGVFADDALDALRARVAIGPGNEKPGKLTAWWNENKGRIRRDRSTGMFAVPG